MKFAATIVVFAFIFASTSFTTNAQDANAQVQLPNAQFTKLSSDLFVKRSKTIPDEPWSKLGIEIITNIANTSDEKEQKEIKEKRTLSMLLIPTEAKRFMCWSNKFWKGDDFQEAEAITLIKRIPFITREARKDWDDAWAKKFGGSMREAITICLIALQDRLFDDKGFNVGESKKLLKRLHSIPSPNFAKIVEIQQLSNEDQAAMTLITIDFLYKDDSFQQEVFDRILKNIGQK